MQKIDRPAGERLATERYESETAFEERYLKPSGQRYEFFGATPQQQAYWRKTRNWPSLLEREKPDFYLPDAKELYECIGMRGKYVRYRETKPTSMLYWCQMLMADGYFSIWNSETQEGYLVPITRIVEAMRSRWTTKEQRDNLLYATPIDLLIGGD